MSDSTDLDKFVADAQAYGQRIQVLDADGNAVDRGDLMLRYTAREGTIVDGLLDGDRLYFDGVLRHWEASTETRIRELARRDHAR